ncbi:TIGR02444 family protein [Martelella soudanensis]|uniref:TIGR02444 family protein n=1 Tax=unclassified Martelella TaxID=2629616 RepID=UPI0015DF0418|nr:MULTISPECIES: TIGR02444 family protein [unclassified Martelella]
MKTQRPLDPQNPFWTGMLALYRRDGVADICLDLQHNHDINVVLLLFFRLCDRERLALSDDRLAAAEASVTPWHENVVLPLRRARRFMKPLAADPAIAANREAIKTREIEAEQTELAMLVRLLDEAGSAGARKPCDNAERFLAKKGVKDDAIARFTSLTG